MSAPVISIAADLADLMKRYEEDSLPVRDLEARALLEGNAAGLRAWADYTNAVGVLGELGTSVNSAQFLPENEPATFPERDEALATAHWLREKADSAEALLTAVTW